MESRDLTRPSLQLGQPWFWRCVHVAELDCVRHTLSGTRGIHASIPDCADSTPDAPGLGCLGSLGPFATCGAATVAGARAGTRALSSKIAVGLEDEVEKADRMLRTACSP